VRAAQQSRIDWPPRGRAVPLAIGEGYRAQDESVLGRGEAILKQLELHFYAQGGRGWCLTDKLPLRGRTGGSSG